ncbi:hypothetical protein STENM327S_08728 [Streptomyces tendae]
MNICGKLASIPLLGPPNDEVLEIGTLYGMFSAGLVRMLERDGRSPALTIVDPFAGVQLQPGTTVRPDPTGTPVDEHAVRTNLALAGPAGAAARVRQGFSEDPATRAAVSDRSYGVIVVDGDHSAKGVRQDLQWAEEIAAPGAIVVLDDFGDPSWPGIEEAPYGAPRTPASPSSGRPPTPPSCGCPERAAHGAGTDTLSDTCDFLTVGSRVPTSFPVPRGSSPHGHCARDARVPR